LGAIVAPTIFLPYATSAATFVTVMSGNLKEINRIFKEGSKNILDYVENMAGKQINEMMKKMDLASNLREYIFDSKGFRVLTE
jgi:hypothetical protein